MARPFLRWAGGKRWLARSLSPLLQDRLCQEGTYFEPFLGGGALFFALEPDRAVLSDLNHHLIAAYNAVANNHTDIVARLSKLHSSSREYARIRDWEPDNEFECAIRLIYLNRNSYGGLYRENQEGRFNVPFGGGDRNHRTICSNGIMRSAAEALKGPDVELIVADFREVVPSVGTGDILYCDPTYREVTRTKFDRYGKSVFDWEDQVDLARLATEAFERGALVLVSNGSSESIEELYPKAQAIRLIRRKGFGPSGQISDREECLFVLDPNEDWRTWSQLETLPDR